LDADELEPIANHLKIEVPDIKKGKKVELQKLILRYLSSKEVEELEDSGVSLFLAIKDIIDNFCEDSVNKTLNSSQTKKEHFENSNHEKTFLPNENLMLHKLKNFKINGSIGYAGQKDKLTYSSLAYQIKNSKIEGFSSHEICAGVIKAISPDNPLRTYLESKPDLNVESLIKIMRSHFKEKDATSLFNELANTSQSVSESSQEFVIRLMSLRQKNLNHV